MTDRLIPADLLARTQIITGLRQLADYLDTHPAIPIAEYGWDLLAFTRHGDDTDDTAGFADVDHIARLLGTPVRDDTPNGGHYRAARTFGRITYEFIHVTARRRALHAAHMSYADNVTPDHDTPEAA